MKKETKKLIEECIKNLERVGKETFGNYPTPNVYFDLSVIRK